MAIPPAKAAIIRRILAEREREEAGDQPKPTKDDQLVDAVEAGRILGLSAHAVRQAAWRGTLPCVRIGRRLRFRRAELVALGRR